MGRVQYANGDVYVGELKDGEAHGRGTYTFSSGDKYEGDWKDGKAHGRGTRTFSDGDKYEGDFKDGKVHGKGTYTFSSGDKYVGDWYEGKKEGKGTFTFSSGDKYEGDFMCTATTMKRARTCAEVALAPPAPEGAFRLLSHDLLETLFALVDYQAALRHVNRACRAAAPETARRVTTEQVLSSVSRCVWMRSVLRCPFSESTLVHAAVRGGDVSMLHWFLHAYHCPFDTDTSLSTTAAAAGHLHVLAYLHLVGAPCARSRRLVRAAAAYGQVEVLRHLRRTRSSVRRFPHFAWLAAVKAGRCDVLEWLSQEKWPVSFERTDGSHEVEAVVERLYLHAFALPFHRAKSVIEFLHYNVCEMGLQFFARDIHFILDELKSHDLLQHIRWVAEILRACNSPFQVEAP